MNNHQIINGFEIDEISKIFSLLLNHRRRNTEERQQTVEKKHKEMSNVNWRSEPDWKKKRQQRSNRWTFSLFLFYFIIIFFFFIFFYFVFRPMEVSSISFPSPSISSFWLILSSLLNVSFEAFKAGNWRSVQIKSPIRSMLFSKRTICRLNVAFFICNH